MDLPDHPAFAAFFGRNGWESFDERSNHASLSGPTSKGAGGSGYHASCGLIDGMIVSAQAGHGAQRRVV